MEYRRLGRTSMQVSCITFGCWAIGAGSEWGGRYSDGVYREALEAALDGGINFFDTASAYGLGYSEEIVGSTLEHVRNRVYIATKAPAQCLIGKKAEESVDGSLKRLSTDYIDVFFVHWPHPDIPVEEPVERLMELKEKGKIRTIGVSNFTLTHLERAVKAGVVDVLQSCYSLYWRHIEKDLLPFCRKHGISMVTYSSIAQGLLTGKFTQEWVFDPSDMRKNTIPLFQGEIYRKALETTAHILEIGKAYGKTGAQIAANWVMGVPYVTSAIVGAKTPAQVRENLQACGWNLSEADRDRIGSLGMEVANMVSDWDTMYQKTDQRLVIRA